MAENGTIYLHGARRMRRRRNASLRQLQYGNKNLLKLLPMGHLHGRRRVCAWSDAKLQRRDANLFFLLLLGYLCPNGNTCYKDNKSTYNMRSCFWRNMPFLHLRVMSAGFRLLGVAGGLQS